MLEGNKYKNVDMDFQLVLGPIDRCTGWMKEAPLMKIVLYSEGMLSVKTDNAPKD